MPMIHKRGDTFELQIDLSLSGQVEDISGWTIRCDLKDLQGNLIKSFSPQEIDYTLGKFLLLASASETENWPIGALRFDLEFTDNSGFIVSSETLSVNIIKDVTRNLP